MLPKAEMGHIAFHHDNAPVSATVMFPYEVHLIKEVKIWYITYQDLSFQFCQRVAP